MDLIVCIVLMFAALLFTVWSGGQLFFATGFGLALFCIYALRHGNSPRQLGAMRMVGVKKALVGAGCCWSSACSPPAGCSAAPFPIWCAWA